MRVVFTVTVAALLLASAQAARAELSEHEDRFMKEMKETVYASNQHMGFSMRSAIIRWLGGVPIVDESDVRASKRDRWWGSVVPLLPADAVKGSVQ